MRVLYLWGRHEWIGKMCGDSEELVNNNQKIKDKKLKNMRGQVKKFFSLLKTVLLLCFIMCYSYFRKNLINFLYI